MAAVGLLTLELRLEDAHSLKDKRRVVKGLKDRLRRRFNVSVAEVDDLELWNSAVLAVAAVSKDRLYAGQLLEAVESDAAGVVGAALTGAAIEWLA